jgi:hypothetical protein
MRPMCDDGTAKFERSVDIDESNEFMTSAGGPTNRKGGSHDLA